MHHFLCNCILLFAFTINIQNDLIFCHLYLFIPSHRNTLTSASKLGRNMTKKFLLICLNKTQHSFHFICGIFVFVFFFFNVVFYVFCVDAAGLIFWGLSLYNGKRPAPKISKVWAIHRPYRNALYKYVHTRICPLGQAKLQCCNSKIIKCNAAP